MINPFDLNTDDTKELKFKKAILFFLGVAFLVFLGIGIYLIININKTAKIEILVAPKDATVKIGENTFSTDQTIRVEPGTYEIHITRDGFYEYTGTIEAKKGKTSYLLECMSSTPDVYNYYQTNAQDEFRCKTINEKQVDVDAEKYLEKNTDRIYSLTPYSDYSGGYKILTKETDQDKEGIDPEKITIWIYLQTCTKENDYNYKRFKQNALNKLEELNIDINNYNLEITSC